MKISKTVVILCLLMNSYTAVSAKGKGYWWGPRDMEEKGKARLKKVEIGLTYMSMRPTLEEEVVETITNPEDPKDITKNQLKNNWNFKVQAMGIFVGVSHPLVKKHYRDGLRETYSALSFYTAPAVNVYTFDCDTFRSYYNVDKKLPHIFRSIQVGSYLGFDYKYGADAVYKKISFTMYSFGVGVYPNVMIAYRPNFEIQNLLKPSLRPYIKGEIGFFTGIAIKLRATIMGSGMYYRETYKYELPHHSVVAERLMTVPIEAQLSLVFMPFSSGWSKY